MGSVPGGMYTVGVRSLGLPAFLVTRAGLRYLGSLRTASPVERGLGSPYPQVIQKDDAAAT